MPSSLSSSDDDGGFSTLCSKSHGPAHSPSSDSSNNDSPTSAEALKIRPKSIKALRRPTDLSTRRELKRSIEKKFRLRYTSLQQAYEQRLEVLAARVQEAVNQVHEDATIHCLQDNALTSEYASARLGEIVHDCFYGERERYIKAMSDQIAWQASDLRESQQKLKVVQRREADAKQQWKLAQRDIQALHHQLDVRVKELQDQKKRENEFKNRLRVVLEERDAARKEMDILKTTQQALGKLQEEHEVLQLKLQQENAHAQTMQHGLSQSVKDLQEAKTKLEMEKQASQQEAAHIKHLLSLSEGKNRELSQTLQRMREEDFPSKVARLETDLTHQQQMSAIADRDHESLKKRYEEFGVQVEQYMNEQAQEKTALISKGEEQVKQLQSQLENVGRQTQDALKAKQVEVTRAMDQLKFRQEAAVKAEKKISLLEERATSLESQQVESKLRYEKQIGGLEKEIVQWRHALEKEQEKVASMQNALAETKERYERKVTSLQEAMNRQSRQGAQEKELEARTRWQNEFVAKQDARIQELKEKYDTALENQQTELLRARQMALDSANAATAKWEQAKLAQKEEEELERRRRSDEAAREKQRREEQRALELTQKRMQQEFDAREKRLLEREKVLVEKEKRDERRRLEEARKASTAPPAAAPSPSVVVLNMGPSEDGEDDEQRVKGTAVVRVTSSSRRQDGKLSDKARRETDLNNDKIPLAQHEAELQAKEAQATLRAEERVQKLMQEFQERKESEFQAAMVNIRKGIHKLEASLEEAKLGKKRADEQLLSERQAFISLKNEFEESKDAKRTIVQRLEETNDNLGRLRTVVKELQAKCQSLEEQHRAAVVAKEKSEAEAITARETDAALREQLARLTEETVRLESSYDTSVETSEQSKKELVDRLAVMEHQLQTREDHFQVEMSAIEEHHELQLREMSEEYTTHLNQLQEAADEAQQGHLDQQAKVNELESSVREVTAIKNSLQNVVEQMKNENAKQKKEFADLSRMHKNLSQAMDGRVYSANEALEEERKRRVVAEIKSVEAAEIAQRARKDKESCLRNYRVKIQHLMRELKDVRKDIVSEMSVGWVHLHKEVTFAGVEWRKRTESLLQGSDAMWKRKTKEDKLEWKKQIVQKDKEMDRLLSSQRVNDQSKYDQVVERLEKKSRELEELETRFSAQLELAANLQQQIQKLEEEHRLQLIEQSRLQERLSTAQNATQEERREKERVSAALKSRKVMCQAYRDFAEALAKSAGTELSPSLMELTKDADSGSVWDSRQFSDELTRLTTCLHETKAQAIDKAIAEATVSTQEGVSAPLVSELESAKKALKFIWGESVGSADDYDEHVPWYLRVARAVKKEKEANEKRLSTLQADLIAKDADNLTALGDKTKWQEAINLLRFEKETALREMELLRQTMQKRKEHELEELRASYNVRIEQLKQRHDRAIMKTDQDNETALNQLRDMLESERRASSHVKNENIELKMALERSEAEIKESHLKLDKETDELRDTVSKWKRKAKLGRKGGGPGNAALRMSSSSHGTEDDSDASYRMMYPYSRRTNAMADLSNLMEQSLVSIRKEALIPPLSPRSNR